MADRTKRHREAPLKRKNPSGRTVWVARYTDSQGVRRLVKPQATFPTKGAAQDAIDAAYELPASAPETLGAYAGTWIERHPRSARTNATNEHRLSRVLDVAIEGRPLRDWPYRELKRRHAVELVRVLLVDQGRARDGAVGILRVLSAMTENAITDESAEVNPFKGVRVKKNDPRIRKVKREPRIYTFAELHEFATCGRAVVPIHPKTDLPRGHTAPRDYEALLRTITDAGRRLGEVLALERRQLVDGVFHFEGTAWQGQVTGDSDTKSHTALVPATQGVLELIAAAPTRIDTKLLFPSPGGMLWRDRNFYRDVWEPARREWARRRGAELDGLTGEALRAEVARVGANINPHDCRHSWVSHLAAAGVDEADLAEMAGHSPETLRAVYRHPLRRSFDAVREAIG